MAQFNWLEVDQRGSDTIPSGLSEAQLSESLKIPLWLARLLWQRSQKWKKRDLADYQKFLGPSLKDLPDPNSLKDMAKAAERVARAVEKKESIAVYGDYDVDGTVGAALFRRFFRSLGVEPRIYQPDRKKEGYGLNSAAIEALCKEGAKLLISVDCGISNFNEVKLAQDLGVDLIVVDHHEVPDPMPPAFAVLDHKRPDDESEVESLCGAGMGFYLALATRALLRERGYFTEERKEPDLRQLLDLVAVATIADMVPLVEENRILAKIGMDKLLRNPQVGLAALLNITGVRPSEIRTYHVGFVIGPRINASGRLGSASIALELLTTDDPDTAEALARELHKVNSERMDLQQSIVEQATEQANRLLEKHGADFPALVLASENWHEGVIGIVAARMVEKFHRPAIVCSFSEGKVIGKGSARSMKDLDVLGCIQACSHLLVGFGGHKAAAGLSLHRENLEAFIQEFAHTVGNAVGAMTKQPGTKLLPRSLPIDIDLTQENLGIDDVQWLEALAPFGIGNPEPVIRMRNFSVVSKKIMKEVHLKLNLRSEAKGSIYEALWFNAPEGLDLEAGDELDLAFTPQLSSFRGDTRVEFRVRDMLVN